MPPAKRKEQGPLPATATTAPFKLEGDAADLDADFKAATIAPAGELKPTGPEGDKSESRYRAWTPREFQDVLSDVLWKVNLGREAQGLMDRVESFYKDTYENAHDRDELNEAAIGAAKEYKETVMDKYKVDKTVAFSDRLEEGKDTLIQNQQPEVDTKAEELDTIHFGDAKDSTKDERIGAIKTGINGLMGDFYDAGVRTAVVGKVGIPSAAEQVIDRYTTNPTAKLDKPEVKKWAADRFLHELNFGKGEAGDGGVQGFVAELSRVTGRKGVLAIHAGKLAARVLSKDKDKAPQTLPMTKEEVSAKAVKILTRFEKYMDKKYEGSTDEQREILLGWLKESHPIPADEAAIDRQFEAFAQEIEEYAVKQAFTESQLEALVTERIKPALKESGSQKQADKEGSKTEPAEVSAQNKYALIPQLTAGLESADKASLAVDLKSYIDSGRDKDALELALSLMDPEDPDRASFIRQIIGIDKGEAPGLYL